MAGGSLHLTAISLLGPHLTAANHDDLLCAATHKSKREVEQLVARLRPQPHVPSIVRKVPAPTLRVVSEPPRVADAPPVAEQPMNSVSSTPVVTTPVPARPAVVKPLTAERYKVQFTVSRETHEKLRHVQDLMRHTVPDGDPAAIFDRALTLLLADLSKAKYCATERPRVGETARVRSRHIPAAVKRAVWRRDDGRCAFQGEHGRCAETGFLEYHHVMPYADGGEASVSNIQLRCRAHNQYEAEQWSGDLWPSQVRENHVRFGT